MKIFNLLLFGMATVLMFSSCNNDDDDDSAALAAVDLHFDYVVGDEAFNYGQDYNIGGTAVNFEFAQFYVHGITLKAEDGTETTFDDLYLLVSPEEEHYEVGEVKPGHYHMLSFNIGVAEADNNQTEEDFTQRAADDPLALQSPEPMHWNWNAGYIFVKINGTTDADGDGTPEERLEFHIGTNNMLRALSIESHTDLESGENEYELEFDIAKLFENIDLSTEYSCHTGDAPELAAKFADNIPSSFTVE